MAKKSAKTISSKNYVVAKTDDGTLQITYTIPFSEIKKAEDLVVDEYAKDAQIAGFRKGKAPRAKVLEKIPTETLTERSLNKILPKLVGETIRTEKLTFALYPKFELLSSKQGEDWQVRAVTCELPDVKLGDYKKETEGNFRAGSLKKELTHQDREQIAIESVFATTTVNIPKLLVEEEVNARLSKLLERIEKLGLSLEQYLASVTKTPETLRADYEKQSKDVLTLDLALMQIAVKEGVKISDKEVDETIKASSADPELVKKLDTPEQRSAIKTVLTKRKALEVLVHL